MALDTATRRRVRAVLADLAPRLAEVPPSARVYAIGVALQQAGLDLSWEEWADVERLGVHLVAVPVAQDHPRA